MKKKNLSDVRQRQKAGVSKKEGSDAGEDECDDHHDCDLNCDDSNENEFGDENEEYCDAEGTLPD